MASKKLVVGVDEAGYGPSMGPLVISTTLWRVPQTLDVRCMATLLEPEFQAKPLKPNSTHIPLGDSKKIFRDRLGDQGLRLGIEALWYELYGTRPDNVDAMIAAFATHDHERVNKVCWYAPEWIMPFSDLEQCVPGYSVHLQTASEKLRQHEMELVGVKMRVLDEPEFNRQIDITQNKSSTLSETSLGLVRDVIQQYGQSGESVEVFCDKHGGRNRYQAVLSYCFDEEWFAIEMEGKTCSRYLGNWQDHEIRIQFMVEGDSLFPSAAASIVAKWTREELMKRLNAFWKSKEQPELGGEFQPTAGYYVDAVRFAESIRATALKLGLAQDLWWRKK